MACWHGGCVCLLLCQWLQVKILRSWWYRKRRRPTTLHLVNRFEMMSIDVQLLGKQFNSQRSHILLSIHRISAVQRDLKLSYIQLFAQVSINRISNSRSCSACDSTEIDLVNKTGCLNFYFEIFTWCIAHFINCIFLSNPNIESNINSDSILVILIPFWMNLLNGL